MKQILIIFGLSTLLFQGSANAHLRLRGDFGFFYSSLAPYGEWVDVNYGHAWRPYHIDHHWRPYLRGSWKWTDCGWYWMSSEPFGWATYHYGRWSYDDYYGWIWIPDDTWGPAWVEWRYDDDFVGWAPLPPSAVFDITIGLTYSSRWIAPIHYWNFVPCRYITSPTVYEYVQPIERTRRIFGSTRRASDIRFEDNRIVNGGVDVREIERRTNNRIVKTDLTYRERGDGDRIIRDSDRERIEAFRPRLDAGIRPGSRERLTTSPNEQQRSQNAPGGNRTSPGSGDARFRRDEVRREQQKDIDEQRSVRPGRPQNEINQRKPEGRIDQQAPSRREFRRDEQRQMRVPPPQAPAQRPEKFNRPERQRLAPSPQGRPPMDRPAPGREEQRPRGRRP